MNILEGCPKRSHAAVQVFAAKQAVLEGSLSSRNAFVSAAEAALRGRLDERPERRDVILNEDGQPVEETEEVRSLFESPREQLSM